MGIAVDMRNLGEDIIASYDTRIKTIGTLVKDTHNMLKGFQVEHKEMANDLKADLAKGEEDRLRGFKTLMANIQKFMSELTKEVNEMIKGFQKEHKEMADALAESLNKGEEDRIKAFKLMMKNIQKEIKEIETHVKERLKEFSDAHANMSEEVREELAKYADDMVKATKKLMRDIQARQKERNMEVSDLLEAFKAEREKMAANWQVLVARMAKKRGDGPVISANAGVKTVEEAISRRGKGRKRGMGKRQVSGKIGYGAPNYKFAT